MFKQSPPPGVSIPAASGGTRGRVHTVAPGVSIPAGC
jgi:hypothetical protein